MVRALEVYFLTGEPLTASFRSDGVASRRTQIVAVALSPPDRVDRRARAEARGHAVRAGPLDEIRGATGARSSRKARVPSVGSYTGRRSSCCMALEAKRRLAVDRTREPHYARRQLIWFRKEPNLVWLQTSGENPETLTAVEALLP